MCIHENNICLGSPQWANADDLGCILMKGRKNSHKILEMVSCSFKISTFQALIWYIGVFVTLLVWVPLKLGYFLPHCCSTIPGRVDPGRLDSGRLDPMPSWPAFQNLHTPKSIHFSEDPQKYWKSIFWTQRIARAYVYLKITEYIHYTHHHHHPRQRAYIRPCLGHNHSKPFFLKVNTCDIPVK